MKQPHQTVRLLAALALVTLLAACVDRYGYDRDHGRYEGNMKYGDSYGSDDDEHDSGAMHRDDYGNRR